MNFINPKTDFAFKKIFGSETNKDILISFLNALIYNEEPVIQDLEFIDPYQAPKIKGIKDTYLDVKAKINDHETVIIEMQVLNLEGFEKRVLYNAAKSYSMQLVKGERYSLLNPVIALTITDFEMFEQIDSLISRFVLKEKQFLIDYPIYDLELVFVELPKFKKTLEQIETLTDKWLYFLKSARSLESIPENMGDVPAVRKAFEVANRINLTAIELDDLEKQEFFIYDFRNLAENSMKKGLEQGLKQGVQQGLEQGVQQGKIAVARQLLDILDDATISEKTGLDLEQVRSLRI